MIQDLFSILTPILILVGGILATTVFVFLKSEASAMVKFILVPLAFSAAIAVPVSFVTKLGYSVPLELPSDFVLLSHRMVITDNKKHQIEIWTLPKGEVRTRLYVLPYSKSLEQKLKEAEQGRRRGLESRLHREDGEFLLKLLPPSMILPPKSPIDAEPPPPTVSPKFMI